MAKASGRDFDRGIGRREALKGLGLVSGVGALAMGMRFGLSGSGAPEEDFRKALEFHREGRYQEAIGLFNSVTAARPQDALPIILRGSAYANAGQFREAAKSYSQALELAPDNAVVYLYRGEAFLALGLVAEARRDFSAAMDLADNDERIASAAGVHLRSAATRSTLEGSER